MTISRRGLFKFLASAALAATTATNAVAGLIVQAGARLGVQSGEYTGTPWSVYFAGYTPGTPWEIMAGDTVIMDGNYTGYGDGMISGALRIQPGPGAYSLQCTKLMCMDGGSFYIGNESATARFTGTWTLELNGADSGVSSNDGDRGMMLHGTDTTGFDFNEYSTELAQTWCILQGTAEAGDTSITVQPSVHGWNVGDKIVIGNTSKYCYGGPEVRIITAIDGGLISFTEPLERRHWGVLQYVCDVGLSLDPEAPYTLKPDPAAAHILDHRARVMNMTRRVVFQGANDSAWATNKFGATIMIDKARGVKFRTTSMKWLRCGQQGKQRRYPFHLHVLSYETVGGLVTNYYLGRVPAGNIRIYKSAFEDCFNRCYVFHSSHGAEAWYNTHYNWRGHCYHFEDACEERNTVAYCWGMDGRGQPADKVLPIGGANELAKAMDAGDERGASFIWLTNPNNDIYYCGANYCEGVTLWMGIPTGALGISGGSPLGTQAPGAGVIIAPNNLAPGNIHHMYAMGHMGSANLLRGAPINVAGDTAFNVIYQPPDLFSPHLIGFEGYHCYYGIWRNRSGVPDYDQFVGSDCCAVMFNGATTDFFGQADGYFGLIRRSVLWGYSFNSPEGEQDREESTWPYDWLLIGLPAGSGSYHSSIVYTKNAYGGWPRLFNSTDGVPYAASGAWLVNDQYVRPFEGGWARHVGNVYLGDPETNYRGWRTPPPNPAGVEPPVGWFTFATCINDLPGNLGGAPGTVNIYNDPSFYTGCADYAVLDEGYAAQVSGVFGGFNNFAAGFKSPHVGDGFPEPFTVKCKWQRFDAAGVQIGMDWLVNYSSYNPPPKPFSIFRHVAYPGDQPGWIKMSFPDGQVPNWMITEITGLHNTSSSITKFYPLDLSVSVTQVAYSAVNKGYPGRNCTPVASKALVDAGAGDLYWPDVANNQIYVKVVCNLFYPWVVTPDSDIGILRPYALYYKNANGEYYA